MPSKKTKVMAFGTFDILHYGHVKLLEQARSLGGNDVELIVVIARDSTVIKEKGHHPIFPEDERLALIKSLKVVDAVHLGSEGPDHLKIIEKCKPDIIALGYDQKIDSEYLKKELQKRGLKDIKIFRLKKYGTPGINSSSKILEKLEERIQRLIRFYS
ncbi:MAG: adenylyltransferase/cytidyltransferase family protein [Promethearchaeota archaeon]